jgi:hypothetical protein
VAAGLDSHPIRLPPHGLKQEKPCGVNLIRTEGGEGINTVPRACGSKLWARGL